MKRIDTSTVAEDLFGTGRDGCTDGDAPTAVPPTSMNASFFNALQQALANTVELDGKTLDGAQDDFQVPDTILGMLRDLCSSTQGFVTSGLTWVIDSGLDADLDEPGVFYADGRRYTVTSIDPADTPRTFADDDVRYVYIEPDPADERGYVIVDSPSLAPQRGRALTAIITTAGGSITSIVNWSAIVTGQAMLNLAALRVDQLRPQDSLATVGNVGTQLDNVPGRFVNVASRELNLGEDRSNDSTDTTRAEIRRLVHSETLVGSGTADEILVTTTEGQDDDAVTLRILVSGRRTDASNFGYCAEVIIGANKQSGAWVFNGTASVVHEQGDGGGVRTVRLVIDGSNRIVLRHSLSNAETWVFVTEVSLIYNFAA